MTKTERACPNLFECFQLLQQFDNMLSGIHIISALTATKINYSQNVNLTKQPKQSQQNSLNIPEQNNNGKINAH